MEKNIQLYFDAPTETDNRYIVGVKLPQDEGFSFKSYGSRSDYEDETLHRALFDDLLRHGKFDSVYTQRSEQESLASKWSKFGVVIKAMEYISEVGLKVQSWRYRMMTVEDDWTSEGDKSESEEEDNDLDDIGFQDFMDDLYDNGSSTAEAPTTEVCVETDGETEPLSEDVKTCVSKRTWDEEEATRIDPDNHVSLQKLLEERTRTDQDNRGMRQELLFSSDSAMTWCGDAGGLFLRPALELFSITGTPLDRHPMKGEVEMLSEIEDLKCIYDDKEDYGRVIVIARGGRVSAAMRVIVRNGVLKIVNFGYRPHDFQEVATDAVLKILLEVIKVDETTRIFAEVNEFSLISSRQLQVAGFAFEAKIPNYFYGLNTDIWSYKNA